MGGRGGGLLPAGVWGIELIGSTPATPDGAADTALALLDAAPNPIPVPPTRAGEETELESDAADRGLDAPRDDEDNEESDPGKGGGIGGKSMADARSLADF